MTEQTSTARCLSCAKTEEETPLVVLKYNAKTLHVCPQCMPVIIHHPERLAEKIASA